MMHQLRCETCKNCIKNPNDDYFCSVMNDEIDFTDFEHTAKVGCASHSDFQSELNTVWVVAESRFEYYEVKHICSSKEVALQRWAELRDELIKGNQDMVEHCIKEGGYQYDADMWEKQIELLKNLKPGESCNCDCPDLKKWELELR